jgi:hypothetical protein
MIKRLLRVLYMLGLILFMSWLPVTQAAGLIMALVCGILAAIFFTLAREPKS